MQDELKRIQKDFFDSLKTTDTFEGVEDLRVKFLGRKSELTLIFRSLGKLDEKLRSTIGKEANELRQCMESHLKEKLKELKEKKESKVQIDPTLSPPPSYLGREHPINIIIEEIINIFLPLGFQVARGPEIELDYYNFEALNFPSDHPARDEQDSFKLAGGKYILRTQTSPVQVRMMEKMKPPIRIISPGRCFRRDAVDSSHLPMFHQVEGLAVDTDIHFSDLKGVLEEFILHMFGKDVRMRFTPSFFPFTEPSAEVAISCIMCKGEGCQTCKKRGWLEILGAGMVHPNVFRKVNYNPQEYTGFAFGMGVERIAMLKYGIGDIRLFYQNHLYFLSQF